MKSMFPKVLGCAMAALFAVPTVAGAQAPAKRTPNYPERTVRLVVPFAAGGASDVIARIVAQKMAEIWGSPIVVENRPGASGAIGTEHVMHAEPDGYTLLMGGPSTLSGPVAINPKLGYDSVKDFAHVSIVCSFPSVLAVTPGVAKSLPELIATLKANPGKYNYASSGNGTTSHLIAELFKSMTGTNIGHVPYKGSAPGLNDVMAGHVAMSFDPLNVVTPLVRGGKLVALGVTSTQRSKEFPDVPAIAEVVPGFEADSWIAFLAPLNTPAPIVDKIAQTVRAAVHAPDLVAKFNELSLTPVGSSPAEFAAMIKNDVEKWRHIVRVANIKAD